MIILEDRTQASPRSDLHTALEPAGCRVIIKHAHTLPHDKMGTFDAGTPGTADLNQGKIRQVVAALLAEGYAEVFSTKEFLDSVVTRST